MRLRQPSKETVQLWQSQITEAAKNPEFQLVTTLRWDKRLSELTRRIPIAMEASYNDEFFLGRLHYHRLKFGASVLNWPDLKYATLREAVEVAVATVNGSQAKVRVTYSATGDIGAEATAISSRDNLFCGLSDMPYDRETSDPTFDVVVDSQPTKKSLYTLLKTSLRAVYDEARSRNNIKLGDSKEVLMFNENNQITEGSLCSVALLRDGKWITPLSAETMCGVLRSFLLELGFIEEGAIDKSEIAAGDQVLLFNGVMGVVKGIVR